MTEEEMYDVNGGFWGWSSSKFIKNLDGLFSGVQDNMPMGIGTILSSMAKAAALGYKAVFPFFPKLVLAVSAVPLPGFCAIALTLAAAGSGLALSMGYFRMFY